MRKTLLAGLMAGALAAGIAGTAQAAIEPGTAQLSVLHGVPDLVVDVYVNGELTLDDFAPGDLAGPLTLPPGTYSVAITAADAADDSAPVLGPIDLPLEADNSYTAVAHLDAAGAPTASFFTNNIATAEDGAGRLIVRHTAAAPAVDIWVDGAVLFESLENPNEVEGDVPAATYSAAVSAAGATEPVLGPADVPIEAGVATIVYAWGSLEAGNLALAVQTVPLTVPEVEMTEEPAPEPSPSVSPSDDAEAGEDSEGMNGWLIAAIAAAVAAIIAIIAVVSNRRKKTTA